MPPARSSARGGRRGRGRGGRGRGAAAAGTRRKRAVDSEVIVLDEDFLLTAASDCADAGEPTPTRNLWRLRKQTMESSAADTKEHVVDVAVDVNDNDTKDPGNLAPCGSLKACLLKDISNGLAESEAKVVKEIRQSGQKLDQHRRSKRLQAKPTGIQDLGGGDSDSYIFEDSLSSSEDEKGRIVPKRSKRLRRKFTSEYANGEVSEDKNSWKNSSDDDNDSAAPRRRSKHHKLRTRSSPNDDGDDSDAVNCPGKAIPCRRMSKRLQEKQKVDHISNESSTKASSSMLSTSSSSDDELLCNSVKSSKRFSHGPMCSIYPPLQDGIRTSECSFCKINQTSLAMATEENFVKKIQRYVGHRMLVIQDSGFQYQFLVKWQSLSHHHDCWVPLEWLQVFDRIRVQSYLKKSILLKEAYLEDQRKPEWFEVDRAIACRRKSGSDSTCDILTAIQDNEDLQEYEFLVKWKGLDYCEATWESCCTEGVQVAISKLVERHQIASKRIDCVSPICLEGVITEDVHNGALYSYQHQGLQWIFDNFKARRNVILADEMGLGKTVQVVCFLNHIIKERFTLFPALVLAPKSILLQWEKEFGRWGSDLNVIVYQGDKDSRKCIQAHEMYLSEGRVLFDALVTSYEFVQIDKSVLHKFKWSAIISDEAHRMKKLDCNLASCLKRYSSEFRLLLTGTPLQNNMLELFSLLHYIDPDEFSDPDADGLFTNIDSGEELTMEEKIARIHDILKPRMLRRLKSDVLTDSMPTKKWVEVPCALTDTQRELYIDILEKNYSKLNGAIRNGKKLALNNILMQLRKCCNHPFLFQGLETKQQAEDVFLSLVSASGKLQLLHKLLPKLKERGNRVLIFSQMTMMLDILEDFLFYLGYKYARIDGQTSLSNRQESIKEYNRAGSETFIFLMSTRAGGLGVDLPGADRVIIYDPDFNPFMDLQAQSRAHRIGQTRPVVVYQLITKCSVEEKILQKSKQKLAIENMIMNSSKKLDADELQSILLHGAKTIIDRKKVSATSIYYDDEAIENLLKLDPNSEDKCSKEDNGYLGSIVSFAHSVEDQEPGSPKVEDLEVLKPATPKVDLGRGKRQRRAVNYNDAVENSDSDDMYTPEGSSTSSSSSSDDDNDYDADCVVSAQVVPAHEAQTPNVTSAIEASGAVPALEVLKGPSRSGSSSSVDDKGDDKPSVADI
uniref:CHD3-type chromatin-remodeling factor PICKLE n=1 Tax=Setaria italica TaxID=4555 RepID=K3XRZ6_SETIT